MVAEEVSSVRNACIVVAHPDDEILWFSSIVRHVSLILVCFEGNPSRPKMGEGRRAAIEQIPLPRFVSLGMDEADVYDQARWPSPDTAPEGLRLAKAADALAIRRYRQNFPRLRDDLRQRLAGFDTVFTHNPWGEYGHEEHVQVYRAVAGIQRELGFALWCSSYAGSRSLGLMSRCLEGARVDAITLDTDPAFARRAAALYQAQGVWTWFDEYAWPRQESFLHFAGASKKGAGPQSLPLNYLEMGPPPTPLADRSLRGLARKARRLLRLDSGPDTFLI